MARSAAGIRYLEQAIFMAACKVRKGLEERWHAAVTDYARASRDLLKGPPERSAEINRTYESARLEFEQSKRLLDEHLKEHGCQRGSVTRFVK